MGRRCPRIEPSLHLGLREQAARGSGELCLPLFFRVRGADCPRRQDPIGMTFPLVGFGPLVRLQGGDSVVGPRRNPSVHQFLSAGIPGS